MSWHRGYLLYGPPGTGKTSIAWALAHHFALDLWYMPLADIEKDQELIRLVSNVKPRSMLLLEDIDVFHAAKVREDDNGVSMSGLLNSLDGVATPHGLITVMTTNDRSMLDDALVRPGRIDRTEEIGLLDDDQGMRLLQLFYPALKEHEARRVGRACAGRAPSDVLEVCKRHLDDPTTALRELSYV
jgi:chaperone BCS1